MDPIAYLTPQITDFKDRKNTLLVVGILLIVAGTLAGCVSLMMPLAFLAPQPPGMVPPRRIDVIASVGIYVLTAAIFITVGIGSLRRRRWVQPLVLIAGWIWLIIGVGAMLFWLAALPDFGNVMVVSRPPGVPPPPRAFLNAMAAFMSVFMFLVYLVLPALVLWLYWGDDMRRTLQFYDTQPRWTDRCPTKALGLSLIMLLGALWSMLLMMHGAYFAFGVIWTGTLARIALAITALMFLITAWLTYRLKPAGWWLAVLLLVILPASVAVTLMRVNLVDVYRLMGMPEAQIQMMMSLRALRSGVFVVQISVMALIAIGYALYVRRYYFARTAQLNLPGAAAAQTSRDLPLV